MEEWGGGGRDISWIGSCKGDVTFYMEEKEEGVGRC